MGFRLITPKRVRKIKSEGAQKVLDRLDEFLKSADVTENPVEILCRFWEDQQTAITYQELREAVKAGHVNDAIFRQWTQDYAHLVKTQLNDLWRKAMEAGAAKQPLVEAIAGGFVFNTQTPGILSWLNEKGAEFVTACTRQQKDAIAALLSKKMIEGHTVDELARMIRPCIGLTQADAKAASSLYDSIVARLKEEHPKMKADSIRRKALDATTKFAERKHRARALTIAQTESAFAYNRGADEGIRQAQAQKLIGTVRKRWSTSGDDGVCDVCAALEGVETDMDAEFAFREKYYLPAQHLLPPAHPRCACAVEYIEIEPPYMSNSLGAGNIHESESEIKLKEPQYLGSLDDFSDNMVKSTLEKYESEIVNSDIENAIVVTKSGLVFQCFGDKNGVYPNVQLRDELIGASITHNHPVGSANEYSFSRNDISLFMEYNLKLLRGVDEKYIYELSRNPVEIDSHSTLEELISLGCDFARHEKVIDIAREFGIGYRRWKR